MFDFGGGWVCVECVLVGWFGGVGVCGVEVGFLVDDWGLSVDLDSVHGCFLLIYF